MNTFQILVTYKQGLLQGLWVTLKLCLLIWSVGLGIGGLLGVLGTRWPILIGIPSRLMSFVLSGIPVLVILFWLHYPLQSLLKIVVDPFWTASAAIALINVFTIADLVRTILLEFPKEYITASKVSGMSSFHSLRYIQLPIILRQLLPGLLTSQVSMLQMTLFASLISVDEIFRVTQRINATEYKPVEIYTALGILFLLVCLPLNGLALFLKQKYTRNTSEA